MKKKRVRISTIDPEPYQRLREQGMSCEEIGEAIGITEECCRRRMVKMGIPRLAKKARPHKNRFWKGGRIVDKNGYVLIKSIGHPYATKARYVREHRLVMEKHLGRYLLPREVVHHIDKDRANNNIGNLELYGSNADHLRAELTGRKKNVSPEGRQRMRESILRTHQRRRANQAKS